MNANNNNNSNNNPNRLFDVYMHIIINIDCNLTYLLYWSGYNWRIILARSLYQYKSWGIRSSLKSVVHSKRTASKTLKGKKWSS